MSLSVRYFSRVEDALADAKLHVERVVAAVDLFDQVHVLVPSVGQRWWLTEQLAPIFGGSGKGDGILANVKFHLPMVLGRGSLTRKGNYSWDDERVAGLLLGYFDRLESEDHDPHAREFVRTSGGKLSAAGRLTGMFARYGSRRAAMLRMWAENNATLLPVSTPSGGEATAKVLATSDAWQFDAWNYVYQQLGSEHPRINVAHLAEEAKALQHLLVFGFETLDLDTLHLLRQYAEHAEVTALLVTPSTRLVAEVVESLKAVQPTNRAPFERSFSEVCPPAWQEKGLDLPFQWYRGVRESLALMKSMGIQPELPVPANSSLGGHTTLSAFQTVIRDGSSKIEGRHLNDQTLELHLCHGKARQAEVAADAVIAALQDPALGDLQLQDIAIVTPDLQGMAPHLQAAFGKEVSLKFDESATSDALHPTTLPMLVADRSLGEMDAGAEFFVSLLSLIGGRVDKASFFDLLQQPEFAKLKGIGADQIERWGLFTERAEQRWAIDSAHRQSILNLDELGQKHTWLDTQRRVLLGAIGARETEVPLLGRMPIVDVDVEELDDVLRLLGIINAIREAVDGAQAKRNAAAWVQLLDRLLERLCGVDSEFVRVPAMELRKLAKIDVDGNTELDFLDVQKYLQAQFTVVPEATYRRDGQILVTNMASQHLVPHRMVCIVGLDDGSLPTGAVDGNDLTSRQAVEGDSDPRHDVRRQILNVIMSTTDQVVLVCDGQSSKNNQPLPRVTPLQELLDYSKSVGVPIGERIHPRHRLSERNFYVDEILARPWSHDESSRVIIDEARKARRKITEERKTDESGTTKEDLSSWPTPLVPVELKQVLSMLQYPLSEYLKHTLRITSQWEDDEVDYTTLPLELTRGHFVKLLREYTGTSDGKGNVAELERKWEEQDLLPLTEHGRTSALESIRKAHGAISEILNSDAKSGSLQIIEEEACSLQLPDGSTLIGSKPVLGTNGKVVVLFRPDKLIKEGNRWRYVDRAALECLFAIAAGVDFEKWQVIIEYEKNKGVTEWQSFQVEVKNDDKAVTRQEALDWLQALVRLWSVAAKIAVPTFGSKRESSVGDTFFAEAKDDETRSANDEEALEAFVNFVSQESTDYKKPYALSDEALVFGAEPKFEECFVHNSTPEAFWQARKTLWQPSTPRIVKKVRPVTLMKSTSDVARPEAGD